MPQGVWRGVDVTFDLTDTWYLTRSQLLPLRPLVHTAEAL